MSATYEKTFDAFDRVIRKHLASFGVSPDRSSFTKPAGELPEGANESYWLEGANTKTHWDSARTAGYLAGYVDFAGPTFPGVGIRVAEGFVRLDKGVMCSLLVGECIDFSRGNFVLTEKGQALIAPFVRLPADSKVGWS